tara:strand:- start:27 stop:503 length:477 start_codon:yes stop_codon:yes gene_type:complete
MREKTNWKFEEKKSVVKCEFLLTLNENIICQRYFNVRNYNLNAKNSVDLYDTISDIGEELKHSLKNKAFDYIYDRYNHYTNYVNLSDQDLERSEDEVFHLYVKQNTDILIHKIIPSDVYPGRIRYTVDIRPLVPQILGDLTDTLSRKKIARKYLNLEL